jgi:hypothetical protein
LVVVVVVAVVAAATAADSTIYCLYRSVDLATSSSPRWFGLGVCDEETETFIFFVVVNFSVRE